MKPDEIAKSINTARPRTDLSSGNQSSIINHQSSVINQPTDNQSPAIKQPTSRLSGFSGLDHLAIVVPDTQEALRLWRDVFGFEVLYSENVNENTVRLTHLDLGNTHLQLVEPLTANHPLREWLAKHGPGLHHFCLRVENVEQAKDASPVPTAPNMHQGTLGKRALFLDKSATQGIQVEVTGI